jgi:hypothetical protein
MRRIVHASHGCLSLIVLVIDERGTLALKREGEPPVRIDPHGPASRQLALERVKALTGQMHIRGRGGPVEPPKLQAEALGVLWLDAGLGAPEEPLQAWMAKRPEH